MIRIVVVGPIFLHRSFRRRSHGSKSCRVVPLPILRSLILGSGVEPLAEHQGLLDDLHLAEDVRLLLLQLLQGDGITASFRGAEVSLLQYIDLELLL